MPFGAICWRTEMKAFVVFLLLTIMTAVVIALTGCGGGGSENVLSPPA
jgi:hypothetical protein